MGELQIPHFNELFFFGRFQTVPNQSNLFMETLGYLKNKKSLGIFSNMIFINLKVSEIHVFDIFREDGHREILPIRLIKSWKSWIWDQYLPENMEWQFGKISKPRKKTTKNKPRNQHFCYFQVRGSPAPLNIPTPTPAPDHPIRRFSFERKGRSLIEDPG